jgi:hypothetical protein
MKNSFKELPDEPTPPPDVEKRIFGQLNGLRFLGEVIELYLSKMFSTILALIGGDDKKV